MAERVQRRIQSYRNKSGGPQLSAADRFRNEHLKGKGDKRANAIQSKRLKSEVLVDVTGIGHETAAEISSQIDEFFHLVHVRRSYQNSIHFL